MFPALPAALQLLISPILYFLSYQSSHATTPTRELSFTLRHTHAVANGSRVLLADVPPAAQLAGETYAVKTDRVRAHRPRERAAFVEARERSRAMRLRNSEPETEADLWSAEEVDAPDVRDRAALLALAKMTSNAYYVPSDAAWYDLPEPWANTSRPFGWEPDADGFRGHIFATPDNGTVVLTIKGTSAGWLAGGGGPTVRKDRRNDNMLFSCCCARVGPTWSTVCGCYRGAGEEGRRCDVDCLGRALMEESLFYNVATNLYNNATYLYPGANIWAIGHSLGGSLASLLGATFGVPVVAFEAPGEKMAAARLHLPAPPSTHHITHVYHTADPIAMGVCTGVTSLCALSGYALESRCHLGRVVLFDTVARLGWAVDVRTHAIRRVIEGILEQEVEVPAPEEQRECVDCYDWEYGSFKKKEEL